MTDNVDDVFDDDDPFENLEERLTGVLSSDNSDAPEPPNESPDSADSTDCADPEFRLIMERIKRRATERSSGADSAPGGEHEESGAVAPEPIDERPAPSPSPEPSEFSGSPWLEVEQDVVGLVVAEPDSAGSFRRAEAGRPAAWPGSVESAEEPPEGLDQPVWLGDATWLESDEPLTDVASGSKGTDDVPSVNNRPDAGAGSRGTGDVLSVNNRPDAVASVSEGPGDVPAVRGRPEADVFVNNSVGEPDSGPVSTFGSLVADPAKRSDAEPLLWGSAAPEHPEPSSRLPPSGVAPLPATNASVQPVSRERAPTGVTETLVIPNEIRLQPRGGPDPAPQKPSPAPSHNAIAPTVTYLSAGSDGGSARVKDRERSSQGLIFIVGGITVIVLSVLIYSRYFLGGMSDEPTQDMAPTSDDTTSSDATETTFTGAAPPDVEVTGCDSQGAHIVVTSHNETPIVAMIRFQFLKDNQVYYEEESPTPELTQEEALTKSLLLIGKELPPDFVDAEPDKCTADVISVAES